MKHWPPGMSIVEEREGLLKWEMRKVLMKPCLCDLPAVEREAPSSLAVGDKESVNEALVSWFVD